MPPTAGQGSMPHFEPGAALATLGAERAGEEERSACEPQNGVSLTSFFFSFKKRKILIVAVCIQRLSHFFSPMNSSTHFSFYIPFFSQSPSILHIFLHKFAILFVFFCFCLRWIIIHSLNKEAADAPSSNGELAQKLIEF